MFNGSAHETRQDNCRGDVRATDLQNCEKPYQRLIRNRYNSELDHEYGDLRLSVLQSVGNREGQTRVNDTRTADSIQLESRTRPDSNSVDCSESDYQTIGAVTADANSSYTHPAHRRICMIVVVAVVCLMLAGSIVAGIIIAKQGLARASNTETSVHCSTNGSEKEKPNCIIPGSISFSELEYGFNFGEDGILICRVDHYPQWQHVRIIKETPDANLTVFDITNETGVIESSSFIQNASYKLHNDGLTIELKFNPVNCSDEGTYYGLVIVGDTVNDVVANTTVHIQAELSSPKIVVPEQILVSREFVVTCTGYVGRNSNGTYGLISLEKRINGNGDFTTEGVGNDSARCDGKTFVTTNVTTNRTVRNLGFRCKIEGPNGITMYSDVINRTVIHSFTSVAQNATVITTAAPGPSAAANATGPGTGGSGSSSYTTVAQNATVITTAAPGAPATANATEPGTDGSGSSSNTNGTQGGNNTSPCTSFSPLTVLS